MNGEKFLSGSRGVNGYSCVHSGALNFVRNRECSQMCHSHLSSFSTFCSLGTLLACALDFSSNALALVQVFELRQKYASIYIVMYVWTVVRQVNCW